jgi:hypothetical protein
MTARDDQGLCPDWEVSPTERGAMLSRAAELSAIVSRLSRRGQASQALRARLQFELDSLLRVL